jgi:hypothetical protein
MLRPLAAAAHHRGFRPAQPLPLSTMKPPSILVACGYVVYLGIRLWDKERARKMVRRVMKSKEQRRKEHL